MALVLLEVIYKVRPFVCEGSAGLSGLFILTAGLTL
jgi:hypothetical protein